MGKLIVIEGSDGSGKATQTKLLAKKLRDEGHFIKELSFPDYESEGSALVKMYLRGEFGKKAADVSPYAASLFYAVDRFASYKMKWMNDYEAGVVLISDRYVASNFVHQGVKLDKNERSDFIKWLCDLEYEKLGLPKPDLTCFLDMPPNISLSLVKERGREDIHEKDAGYLRKTYEVYKEIATEYGWEKIDCAEGNLPRPVEDIAKEVYNRVKGILQKR
ncbi:MAG: thymidylate kinase [Selenomonadaceae bacterium]|nr:thymidylate kinase [Selenomonadaceae bacterium]